MTTTHIGRMFLPALRLAGSLGAVVLCVAGSPALAQPTPAPTTQAANQTANQTLADRFDDAMQAFGAMGLSQDTHLVHFWAYARHLRMADGPDEVHRNAIAKHELAGYR